MRKIAIINQKGGTGKSTTTVNLGRALSFLGKKVLIIDMDPQANVSYYFGFDSKSTKTIYNVLKGEISIKDALVKKEDLWIVPSILDLCSAEFELAAVAGREFLLKEALKDIPKVDFVFFDCSPSLGLLNMNVLTAADEIFVPVKPEPLGLSGIPRLLQFAELVKKRLNPNLKISGILATMVDLRVKVAKESLAKLNERFETVMLKTMIRQNVSLSESPSHGKSIFDYRKDSKGAEDYMNLAKEVLEMNV